MRNSNVRKLTTSAVLLALAFVLSYVKVYEMPWGGSVTFLSMLPICMVGIMYGPAYGLGTAFCYSWLQILQGGVFSWGLTPGMLIGSLLLDYIVAFTVLGLAGMFRKKGKTGVILGVTAVGVLRFIVHFIAGVVLWANFEDFVILGVSGSNSPVLYSILYNGAYMLPEIVLTVVGTIAFVNSAEIGRFMKAND